MPESLFKLVPKQLKTTGLVVLLSVEKNLLLCQFIKQRSTQLIGYQGNDLQQQYQAFPVRKSKHIAPLLRLGDDTLFNKAYIETSDNAFS
jgi:hypothetical protein